MACASEPVLAFAGLLRVKSSSASESAAKVESSDPALAFLNGGKAREGDTQTGLHVAEPEGAFPVRVDPSVLCDPNLNIGMNLGVAPI